MSVSVILLSRWARAAVWEGELVQGRLGGGLAGPEVTRLIPVMPAQPRCTSHIRSVFL